MVTSCSRSLYVFTLTAVSDYRRTMDIRPNHTIYIHNLNEKIKKDGMCIFTVMCAGLLPATRHYTLPLLFLILIHFFYFKPILLPNIALMEEKGYVQDALF